MVDMGQADRFLYRKPPSMQHEMCWTRALTVAANKMGYDHYIDVPEGRDEELRASARSIQVAMLPRYERK